MSDKSRKLMIFRELFLCELLSVNFPLKKLPSKNNNFFTGKIIVI